MKILIIAPQPFFTVRGTPLAVRELVNVFLKEGHSVDILTLHLGENIYSPNLRIFRGRLFSCLIRNVAPGFSFKKLVLSKALLPKALYLILKNKYDVVHCVEESAYFISWFRWIGNFVFTYDMDSDIPKQLQESGKFKNWFFLAIARQFEKFAVKRADAVVTICPVFTRKIKKIAPNKQVFQIEDISVSDEIPYSGTLSDKKIILYTGNFEKYQGVEVLIEGFNRIKNKYPETELLLVGGEEKDIAGYKERFSVGQIVFAGKKPVSEMPKFLDMADILVSPRSKGENTPYKIYSYLAAGKPILATNIISHSQILTDKKDSLLAGPTAEGMADGLEKILTDNNFAEKIGAGARKLFEENYTKECYEKKVKGYLDFMEDKVCKKR